MAVGTLRKQFLMQLYHSFIYINIYIHMNIYIYIYIYIYMWVWIWVWLWVLVGAFFYNGNYIQGSAFKSIFQRNLTLYLNFNIFVILLVSQFLPVTETGVLLPPLYSECKGYPQPAHPVF